MVAIAIVGRTNNWKDLAEKYRQEAMTVDVHQRHLLAAHEAEMAAVRDRMDGFSDTISALTTELEQSKRDMAGLNIRNARLETETAELRGLSNRLAGELEVANRGWLEQRDLRNQLESRNLELETRNLELNERVNELTAQILVYREQRRQMEQQINILRQEGGMTSLGGSRSTYAGEVTSGPTMAGVTPAGGAASGPILGKVRDVHNDYAQISVGSSDGVQEGQVFVVYRDGQYLGDLRIELVDPNEAAGKLTRIDGSIRNGDAVQDAVSASIGR